MGLFFLVSSKATNGLKKDSFVGRWSPTWFLIETGKAPIPSDIELQNAACPLLPQAHESGLGPTLIMAAWRA